MSLNIARKNLLLRLESYICSVSGIRKIFAHSAEHSGSAVAPIDLLMVQLFVRAFVACVVRPEQSRTVAVATDSRPTRAMLAIAVSHALCMDGCAVRYLGVLPTPQLLAYCARQSEVGGGVCITASHNPIGYNGLKFVNATGAVIDGTQFARMFEFFRTLLADTEQVRRYAEVVEKLVTVCRGRESRVRMSPHMSALAQSRDDYAAIVRTAASPVPVHPAAVVHNSAATTSTPTASTEVPPSHCVVVADYNGSARVRSIDSVLCREYGAHFIALGTKVGGIKRTIEPEGRALRYLQRQLARVVRREGWRMRVRNTRRTPAHYSYFGYMTDNDGDRGNIAYYAPQTRDVRIVPPQELFALLADIRLSAYHRRLAHKTHNSGEVPTPAIVCNGPTSHRVDEVAAQYGGAVFRAEVGEANVVSAAHALGAAAPAPASRASSADARNQNKYAVLLSGEGTNGGCIVSPAQVRDPLVSVLLIIQALRPSAAQQPDAHTATPRPSAHGDAGSDRNVADLLRQLPDYRTTAVTDKEASLPFTSPSAEARLLYILRLLTDLRRTDGAPLPPSVSRVVVCHYLGVEQHHYVDEPLRNYTEHAHTRIRTQLRNNQKIHSALKRGGGLKCNFFDTQGKFIASLWWRGSATEQKVRLIVDASPRYASHYARLMSWHRTMVAEACKSAS